MRDYPTDWFKRLKRSQFPGYESSGTSGSFKSSKSIDWGHEDDPDEYMETEVYLTIFRIYQFVPTQFNSFRELLVNSEVFKLSLNLSLAHLRAQRACYELKGDLNPVILNEIFLDSLKISKIYKDLCGKPFKRDWVTKVGFSHTNSSNFRFGGRCNRYFWDTRLKMYRLPNFNLLFQFMLTKFLKSELFSCLSKVDQVIS